ncbi:ABC transporter ATP-binding protein [Ruminiclostridium josui]|uniref:ABC transporter ATP-binding protein n=1 Tax=Ruminiclostridium josui TaxID=1499 RepID=UPI0004664885|nr:ABC transporter ATP-binding protein [Ruminiclostridium josui]
MEIIRAEGLKKIYKAGVVETEIIKGIDLSIQSGEFVTITGPSGSGKSTLLYLLSGMEPLTEGKVLFNNEDISEMDDAKLSLIRRKDMAFVFQFYNLLTEMSVTDNVLLPSLIMTNPLDDSRLQKMLQLVGLEQYGSKYPYELSGGQQQRVAIARALYTNPKVIFADEPTGNLDSVNSKKVMDIFKQINEQTGITIVMVTHSPKYADYGTQKIYLEDGRIC